MPANSPLIEHYLPIDEISIESIRERAAASAFPIPLNRLHVWWARRPLNTSRAAVAASLVPDDASRADLLAMLGIPETLLAEHADILEAREKGVRSLNGYSQKRAFTYNPSSQHQALLRRNGHTPTVLDVTAGGGSIPFEAGRLGLKTIANELNPVAAFILHSTCEWPQRYGYELRKQYGRELGIGKYNGIMGRYLKRVGELLEGVYPDVGQPKWMADWNEKHKSEIREWTNRPREKICLVVSFRTSDFLPFMRRPDSIVTELAISARRHWNSRTPRYRNPNLRL